MTTRKETTDFVKLAVSIPHCLSSACTRTHAHCLAIISSPHYLDIWSGKINSIIIQMAIPRCCESVYCTNATESGPNRVDTSVCLCAMGIKMIGSLFLIKSTYFRIACKQLTGVCNCSCMVRLWLFNYTSRRESQARHFFHYLAKPSLLQCDDHWCWQ